MLSVAYSPKMEFLFARKMSRAADADLNDGALTWRDGTKKIGRTKTTKG